MDTPTQAPVSGSGLLNDGGTGCFIAAVQVPAGAAPVDVTAGSTDNLQLTATSTTLSSVSDTMLGAVDLNLVALVSLEPPRTGTTTLTASCTVGTGSASDAVTQTTTVVGGDLTLSKTGVSFVGYSLARKPSSVSVCWCCTALCRAQGAIWL